MNLVSSPKPRKVGSVLKKDISFDEENSEKKSTDTLKTENCTQTKFGRARGKSISNGILQKYIKQIIPTQNPKKRKVKLMDWKKYHRLNVIYSFIEELERDYPAICTVSVIGKSVEGRDIKMLKISNSNASNSAVWLDAQNSEKQYLLW